MPRGFVTDEEDAVIGELLGKFLQKHIHADRVVIGQYLKETVSCPRFDCAVGIAVFSDVMTRHNRAQTFETPTIFWFVNPPEPRFVLKHQTDFSTFINLIVDNFL
jgi:hypothetical protein